MDYEKELKALKERYENYQKIITQREAVRDLQLKELKEKYNLDSEEEIPAKLEELDTELAKLETNLTNGITKVKDQLDKIGAELNNVRS